MKPVYQTRFGYPNGNCWEACLASLLEIPLEQVPDRRPEGDRATDAEIADYLLERYGRALAWLRFGASSTPQVLALEAGHYMLGGTCKSGLGHVVVAEKGRVVHNPHPGTDLVAADILWFLVPVERCASPPYGELPTNEQQAAVMVAQAQEVPT